MAEQIIDIPGVGEVSFPEGMSDADIATAAGRLHGDAQAAAAQQRLTAEPEGSGFERAVKGFARTNPLTGLYNLLTTNPLTTLKGIGQSHLDEGAKTIDALKRLVVDRDPLALSEAVGHGVATLTPLVGPAAAHAGELIGSGDIAGGLGETGGLLIGVPSVGGRVVQGAGRAASKVAPLVKTPAKWGGAASLLHGNLPTSAAVYAVPKVLEYGGRALEGVGAKMRESAPGPALSLRRLMGREPVVAPPPPGESLPGYPRLTPTEAPAAPTPVPQPGESLEGYPRVTPTEAPVAPTPIQQPGESLPGYPRVTETEAPAAPTPVLQPGESLPGYPRGTVTPAPSIVETLTQRSGAPRAVGRPLTMTENLQSRVAEGAAPEITPEIAEEGWITPDETLQSVGAPTPTGGRGFWTGLRRGDLWPQLQEELLSTAEGPAAPKPRGRTGPDVRDARGRLKKK